MKKTIKKLQKVAKEDGYYLCPEIIWNETGNTIMYIQSENKRLKDSNERLRKEVKILSRALKDALEAP